jgi:light-regulated signal transduction histidine kinase (bacteriophytochrome)
VVPADHADEVQRLLERIGRGESADNYETVRLNKDGKQIDVSITISSIRDAQGKIIGVSTSARDIGERKQAEEQLKALTADLERSNRELQDFASVASHDLQEPLRKIQTFADDLVVNSGALDDDNRETLHRMQKAAGRMQGLINDLLALSRVTSKARPSSPVDLKDLAREVLIDLEGRIEETGGRVEVGEIPTIDAEPLQMRQLLQNLIGNALKFHPPGRTPIVNVHGELINGDQRPPGSGDAPAPTLCQITVEDNGIGFDEKYVDRIFAMFQRLHSRSEYEGTGIGLAICRKIAEHHGGQITARSVPGQGSTFIVTIPANQNLRRRHNG